MYQLILTHFSRNILCLNQRIGRQHYSETWLGTSLVLDTEWSGAKHRVATSDDHIGAGAGAGQPGHGDVGLAAGGQHGAWQLECDQRQR